MSSLQSTKTEQSLRLVDQSSGPRRARESLIDLATTLMTSRKVNRLKEIIEWSSFHTTGHAHLATSAYLSHPLRVAKLILAECPQPSLDAAVLATVHNLPEVSQLSIQEIENEVGFMIANCVRLLAFDRHQSKPEYRLNYYSMLRRSTDPLIRQIKVLDKLDNLFLLHLNPDPVQRAYYLTEIEQFVIPMVLADLPHLKSVFDELVTLHRNGLGNRRSIH